MHSDYHSLISVDEHGKVLLNVSSLSLDQIQNDAGLDLLNRMVNETGTLYNYEVGETYDRKTLERMEYNQTTADYPDKVSSVNSPQSGKRILDFVNVKNVNGETLYFQGQVAIHPDMVTYIDDENGKEIEQNRNILVFHALEEVYQRTENGLPYEYRIFDKIAKKTVEDKTRKGAHQVAIDKAEKFHDKSKGSTGHGRAKRWEIIKKKKQ